MGKKKVSSIECLMFVLYIVGAVAVSPFVVKGAIGLFNRIERSLYGVSSPLGGGFVSEDDSQVIKMLRK